MMERRNIPIKLMDRNDGQIQGLPANPRKWSMREMSALMESIQGLPEMLEARGCIVVQHDARYVVLGGNMRLEACRRLKMKEIPCIVVPQDMDVRKLREIVIKDNGQFGQWDWDMLANEWEYDLLVKAQIIPWDDEEETKEVKAGGEVSMDGDDKMKLVFKYCEGEMNRVQMALDAIDADSKTALLKLLKVEG